MATEYTIREGREAAIDYPCCQYGEQCLIGLYHQGRLYSCTREADHGRTTPHVAHGPDGTGMAQWDDEA